MKRKWIFFLGGLLLTTAVVAGAKGDALAQTYPTETIKVIAAAAAGGPTDVLARIIGDKFTKAWGQQVVVDARGGASGTIAAEIAARSAPNGYNLFMVYSGVLTINPYLIKKLPYDPIKDFEPVSLFAQVPNVLVVHPSVAAKSVKELIALAKAKPGQLNCANAGRGTTAFMCMQMFKNMAGVDLVSVSYKGDAPSRADLLSGRVQMMFGSLVGLMPHIKAGQLRALAVATPKRIAALPDLPTIAEAGVPGYEVTLWYGMVAPAGTPKVIITKLNAEITKIQKMPDVLEVLKKMGCETIEATPDQMGAYIKQDMVRWAKVIKEAGLEPQ